MGNKYKIKAVNIPANILKHWTAFPFEFQNKLFKIVARKKKKKATKKTHNWLWTSSCSKSNLNSSGREQWSPVVSVWNVTAFKILFMMLAAWKLTIVSQAWSFNGFIFEQSFEWKNYYSLFKRRKFPLYVCKSIGVNYSITQIPKAIQSSSLAAGTLGSTGNLEKRNRNL